ncbi:MAG: beta-ketoacyl synthase N-terminal-like domain-containing protein [Desulfovibrio sp.]|uniref:beta-ketoacyl synthase N-terminal-like domain-containing protein n=1 Tax=Desulfovibrio sp. TaxID=885 RepID=UPI0039E386E3
MRSSPWLDDAYSNAVAVVGMSGRFCNAPDLEQYWQNLCSGFEAARRLSPEEIKTNGCPASYASHPSYVPVCAQMEDVDKFDAAFFNLSPGEAREMDPQLRLMMESSWHAFENAGYVPGNPDMQNLRVGVFAGAAPSSYWLCNVGPDAFNNTGTAFHRSAIVNGQDFLSSWISYKFGFTGPSLNIQTACSTGLVLVASACQHLLDYSCDMALAATASVINPRGWGYVAESGGILAPDGHCRPFDAAAGGTLPGEGAGAVVLKRLADAIEDRDHIQAVIRGYGISNDAHRRAGFAAPCAEGQAAAIRIAQSMANVESRDVGYVEAHGTGTYLGDPIEIAGLSQVFGERSEPCVIGSVKGNLGHLGNAAGMASLLKVILMLRHRYIPATINFNMLNPAIDLDVRRFRIAHGAAAWPEGLGNMAGVSAFGFGGTNCHVVLERTPEWAQAEASANMRHGVMAPLCFSAPDANGLHRLMKRWGKLLENGSKTALEEMAWNLRHTRKLFPCRYAVAASSANEAGTILRERAYENTPCSDAPQLVLLFTDAVDATFLKSITSRLQRHHLCPAVVAAYGEGSASAKAARDLFAEAPLYLYLDVDHASKNAPCSSTNISNCVCLHIPGNAHIAPEIIDTLAARGLRPFRWLPLEAPTPIDGLDDIFSGLVAEFFMAGLNPIIPRDGARRLVLPEYPFTRESHWLSLKTNQAAMQSTQDDTTEPQQNSAEALVLDIWREAFSVPSLLVDDDFYVMGGTSMTAVQILADVENVFGIRISMTEFSSIRTASQMLDTLVRKAE